MPVRFACQCGMQLQAKEEFAGRQMRCPKCKAVLTIPQPAGAAAAPTAAAPAPVSTAAAASPAPATRPAPRPKPPAPKRDPWDTSDLNQEITPWPRELEHRVGEVTDREDRGSLLLPLLVILILGAVALAAVYLWL